AAERRAPVDIQLQPAVAGPSAAALRADAQEQSLPRVPRSLERHRRGEPAGPRRVAGPGPHGAPGGDRHGRLPTRGEPGLPPGPAPVVGARGLARARPRRAPRPRHLGPRDPLGAAACAATRTPRPAAAPPPERTAGSDVDRLRAVERRAPARA